MTLTEIADVVGGTVHGDAETRVTGPAYVDSRAPEPRGLFVAVVGEHVDGHRYAEGAHAVLGSRPTPAPTVVVDGPVAALGRLARHVVDVVNPVVLALTGSQGKTGTKDYLAHV
ncbi:MAG: UDP-N-acetylmuramoyl-tripeptide--D-alanyl-D-alanine ligase, partial [Nocardioides sp.]